MENTEIRKKGLFVVLRGYPHKNQLGLELKIILPIENDEEPKKGHTPSALSAFSAVNMICIE